MFHVLLHEYHADQTVILSVCILCHRTSQACYATHVFCCVQSKSSTRTSFAREQSNFRKQLAGQPEPTAFVVTTVSHMTASSAQRQTIKNADTEAQKPQRLKPQETRQLRGPGVTRGDPWPHRSCELPREPAQKLQQGRDSVSGRGRARRERMANLRTSVDQLGPGELRSACSSQGAGQGGCTRTVSAAVAGGGGRSS